MAHTQSALSHRLIELRSRLNFSQVQMALYLGVPVYTLRKWESGERESGAALTRLLDVLNFLEVFAPALHDGFLAQVLTPEPRHVKKSAPKQSIGSPADSVMSQNPV
jgi:transcriptional regulator with XRE-family HTH domain